MERLKLDLEQLKKALKTLLDSFDVLSQAKSMNNQTFVLAAEDSIIQRFEYTYESFWKFLKKYLKTIDISEDHLSPKKVFHASYKTGICTLEEASICIDMADSRNETSHTYSIEASRVILSDIPHYYATMNNVINRLAQKID